MYMYMYMQTCTHSQSIHTCTQLHTDGETNQHRTWRGNHWLIGQLTRGSQFLYKDQRNTNITHTSSTVHNHQGLTLIVGKGTERSPWTVTSLLDIVALGRFVDFWVKLLLGSCVTVTAGMALITVGRVSPFIIQLDIGTRGRAEEGRGKGGGEREREREKGEEKEYISLIHNGYFFHLQIKI